jgi:hypothetical protein
MTYLETQIYTVVKQTHETQIYYCCKTDQGDRITMYHETQIRSGVHMFNTGFYKM